VGRCKGNDEEEEAEEEADADEEDAEDEDDEEEEEEEEWPRLALCSSHQKYQKKNKTRGFLGQANVY
jgi:hypothetical protein